MRQKMILDEEVVKYIFSGVHLMVEIGEDGYIVHDFDTTYPSKLAVFVPIEVEPSNYSNFFPKSFEDYFRDLDLEISRLSLLIEKGNIFNRFPATEFVAGQVLKREDGNYTIFRFDESVDAKYKTDLLCRTQVDNLSPTEMAGIYTVSEGMNPQTAETIDGVKYLYWILPVDKLFRKHEDDNTLDIWIPMIMESLCR